MKLESTQSGPTLSNIAQYTNTFPILLTSDTKVSELLIQVGERKKEEVIMHWMH